MDHEDHELDLEYLHPGDADVVRLHEGPGGEPRVTVVLPCPECDEPLELDAGVDTVEEADLELPLENATDLYD